MANDNRRIWLPGSVLVLVLLTVWIQPVGAPLVEHDESRYAEISREMLASGDYLVPHLNGIPWYEKPPLLFWVEAAAMRAFGTTPWAARLPSRLAGLGTVAVLFLWVAGQAGRRTALLAALIVAGTPLGWGLSFFNVTDGLLVFFVTAAVLAGHAAVVAASPRRRAVLATVAGAAAACAFLAKGLIGPLFPAVIVGLWAARSGRLRQAPPVIGWALAAAIAVTSPWLLAVARHAPQYLEVLIVREHFQRYTTTLHQRVQPFWFTGAVLAAALTPVLGSFAVALLRRRPRFSEAEQLLVIWFAFVVSFFSLSHSQLPSYAGPALPAASAFIAMRLRHAGRHVASWLPPALLATGIVTYAALHPGVVTERVGASGAAALAAGAAALLAGAWLAPPVARRDPADAAALSIAGWACLYAAIVVTWPRVDTAREMAALRSAIEGARRVSDVQLVSYRTFLKGLPWLLQSPVTVVEPGGELATGLAELGGDSPLAWSEERFWKAWHGERGLLAVVDETRIASFEAAAGGPPRILARARRQLLVANRDLVPVPSADPRTSTALCLPVAETTAVAIASIPEKVLASAKSALGGAPIIRGFVERAPGGFAWELVGGGKHTRLVEIDVTGRVVYTEELVRAETLPAAVTATLNRVAPGVDFAFVKRERRGAGIPERFEFVIRDDTGYRELEVDTRGAIVD